MLVRYCSKSFKLGFSSTWTENFQMYKLGLEKAEDPYNKGLNNPDNHDGVVNYLEPDILEYEVKWPLGSITTNKATGGDEIPGELLKILKS